MRISFAAMLVSLALCSASGAQGQGEAFTFEPGARVRIVTPNISSDQPMRIVRVEGDNVVFRAERRPVIYHVPLNQITAVDVSLGGRRQTLKGALIGVVVGAAVGGVAGWGSYSSDKSGCGFLCSSSAKDQAMFYGAMTAVPGLVLGTAIGWRSRTDKWRRVPLGARTALLSSRGGGSVGISHTF